MSAQRSSRTALEDVARGGVLEAGKPLLNPLPAPRRPPKAARAAKIRPRGA
jgi:hypothetical protein